MHNTAEKIVDFLLADPVQEGKWKSLATAGLLGAAAWQQGRAMQHQPPEPAPVEHRHSRMANPNEELPSEKNLSDFDYVDKKAKEREVYAKAYKPFTDTFMR